MAPWTPWSRSRCAALLLTVLAHCALYAVRDVGVPTSPLQAAASAGDEAALARLLEGSRDGELVRPRSSWRELLLHGNTALHFAAAGGHAACVKSLLAAGAPADAVATLGPYGAVLTARPLFFAASGGHSAVCDAMLAAGADVDDGLDIGPGGIVAREAPLYAAAKGGHTSCARALLQAGASPEVAGGYAALLKVAAPHPNMGLLLRAYREQARAGFKGEDDL